MAATTAAVLPAADVQKSELDTREYRAFSLPNQLRVLLVSDPESDKAAAAMNVAVGQFSDPDRIPGIAHFLEHMLFLGTEKYPDEGSYNQFLGENGGYSNAYTANENTNYQFQLLATRSDTTPAVQQDCDNPQNNLYEALSRFSQFFTAPLFTESATERELKAVDSEHEKNLQNDSWRMHQLQRSLSNKDHPFNKFGTGSKQTLWDDAKEKGVDTREELLAFHAKYYSANQMCLCVSGPYPLDLMQAWVSELFADIVNKNCPHPSTLYGGAEPFTEKELCRLMHVVPVKDSRMLELSWIIPSTFKQFRTKPASYVSHLLGHEGKGSLLSLLKERGWADSLGAGAGNAVEDFAFFEVNIDLTQKGVEHVQEIVRLVFCYLRLVTEKGVERWIYDEAAAIADMSFRFSERTEPFNAVQNLSRQMSIYPPENYISGAYLLCEFDPCGVRGILECLTPDKVNILVVGKFVEGTTDMKEKWYGTDYRIETISEEKVARWRDPEPEPALHIPGKNPFVASDFSLVAEPLPESERDWTGPAVVKKTDHYELHYKMDRTFRRPKASVQVRFVCPNSYASPLASVLTRLYLLLVEDELNEYAYEAEVAGLNYSIRNMTSGMQLGVGGYNDQLRSLLDAILEKMRSLTVDSARFERLVDQLRREYANFDKEQPFQHAVYEMNYLLETPRWRIEQYLQCITSDQVSIEAVEAHIARLLSKMYAVVLVHGNVAEEWALSTCELVYNKLGYSALSRAEHPMCRVLQLPAEKNVLLRKQGPNPEDSNSAVHMHFQVGPLGDLKLDVVVELLTKLLNKPTFHELRTVQQLGYIVAEGVDDVDNIRGIFFIVQSTVADPDELCNRVDAFLDEFRRKDLVAVSDEEFRNFATSLQALKVEKEKRMSLRTRRFWNEILNECYVYDRNRLEYDALEGVCKQDVIDLFDTYLKPGSAKRRRCSSLVYGAGMSMPKSDRESESGDVVVVSDVDAFKRCSYLYPEGGTRPVILAKTD